MIIKHQLFKLMFVLFVLLLDIHFQAGLIV